MASSDAHLKQAEHNALTASRLLGIESHHDWAIVAAFYSALQFFEWWLIGEPEVHSEKSVPPDPKNPSKPMYSVHSHRQKIIQNRLSQKAFAAYTKLMAASTQVRYLSYQGQVLDKTAHEFFPVSGTRRLLENDLAAFKKEMELRNFLRSLELHRLSSPMVEKLIISKIVNFIADKNSLLQNDETSLKLLIGKNETEILRKAFKNIGIEMEK
ncbi:MAG: hypothetical protein V1882_11420 [Candidatus Omnitrophota bacterium]